MDSDQIWNFLAKFISGEASLQEKKLVEEWVKESEENRRTFQLFQTIWNRKVTSEVLDSVDVDKVWQQTKEQLEMKRSSTPVSEAKVHHPGISTPVVMKYAAAAVFLLAAVLTGIFLYQFDEVSEPVVYQTRIGETLRVHLNDGSSVLMAPKSKLTMDAGFNSTSREVHMEGEAYFSVQSDQKKPFRVYTENTITKVLGTKFNVMAIPEGGRLEVLVAEGSVAVEKGNKEAASGKDIILKEGDLLQTEEYQDGYEVANNVYTLPYLKWQEGIIYLDDLPLAKITERLERWYPVEVILESETLAGKKLTAEFSSRQPINEILDAISLALNAEYKQDQGKVIFYE